jgi:hypothetical protein
MREARAMGKWPHPATEYKKVRRDKRIIGEHRAVLEDIYGREAIRRLYVHHKDGNPRNNLCENLELLTPKEHYQIRCAS